MKPAHTALVLLLALAGCASGSDGSGAGQCVMPLAAVVPMTFVANNQRITVPAGIAGKDLTLLLDTGSDLNVVSRKAVPGSRWTDKAGIVEGVGGAVAVTTTKLQQFEFGGLHGGAYADIVDLRPDKNGHTDIDGMLGMSILGAYDVDLDIPDQQLRLYRPSGNCDRPMAVLAPPLYTVPEIHGPNQKLSIKVQVTADGKSLNAQIDTGAHTILFGSAARKLGLTPQQLADDPEVLVSGIGHLAGRRHVLDELDIGDLGIRNLPVDVVQQDMGAQVPINMVVHFFNDEPGVDMLLGMDFIRRVHLWISNSSGHLVMQYPPTSSPPLPATIAH